MKPPTIEDRLREIRTRLGLLGVLAHVDDADDDNGGLEEFRPDAREAILDVIRGAYDELYYLMQLPGRVLNMPVPDDEALGGGDEAALEAARAALVNDYLHRHALDYGADMRPAAPKATRAKAGAK